MSRLRSKRGITLIELMATAVIIGIVAALAVPRFHMAFERIQFRSTNRELVSMVRLARSKALTDKDQYGVFVNPDDMQIVLFKDIVDPAGFAYDDGDSVIKIDTLPGEFSYVGTDCGENSIVFVPNGSARFVGGGNIYTMASTPSMVGISTHNILASTGRIQSDSQYY